MNQTNIPVNDAIVRIQGTTISTRTDVDGKFKIEVKQKVSAKYITAWKSGFYNGGALIYPDKPPYHIVLSPIESADNKNYEWLPSSLDKMTAKTDTGNESQSCQHCHPQLVREWEKSAHSGSAANPVFLTFFNGTDVDGNRNIDPGFKIHCQDCHMKPDGETFRFALEKAGGLNRYPATIPSHTIFGIMNKGFNFKIF